MIELIKTTTNLTLKNSTSNIDFAAPAVKSVNGKIGDVTLTAKDVNAVDTEELTDAVNEALAEAKESGAFDGADGKDGAKGADGENGKDGISATHKWNGTTLTITSASGTSSADLKGDKGDTGANGSDYVLTDTDKEDIAQIAIDVFDASILLELGVVE